MCGGMSTKSTRYLITSNEKNEWSPTAEDYHTGVANEMIVNRQSQFGTWRRGVMPICGMSTKATRYLINGNKKNERSRTAEDYQTGVANEMILT